MIVGLPNDEKKDLFDTVKLINQVHSWGIKIHLLYILKGSQLEEYYHRHNFKIYERDEYTTTVVQLIEKLNPRIVIHRLYGRCWICLCLCGVLIKELY